MHASAAPASQPRKHRHWARAAVAIVFISALSASGQSQTPPSPPAKPAKAEGTAAIRGRVTSLATGKSLPNVQVRLLVNGLLARSVAVTDAEGRFAMEDVLAGRYTLAVMKDGYVSVSYGQRRPTDSPRPFDLRDGQVMEKVELAVPPGGVINGRLTDDFGEPVEGATIQVRRLRYNAGVRQFVPVRMPRIPATNDLGRFHLFDLPPGQYIVLAPSHRGAALPGFATTYYPGTVKRAEARPVTLGVSQAVNDVEFSLVPARAGAVSGRLVDSKGAPLAARCILISRDEEDLGDARSVVADATGRFEFIRIPAGEYRLIVRPDSVEPGAAGEKGVFPITTTGDRLADLQFQTRPGAGARGRIIVDGPPLASPLRPMVRPTPLDPITAVLDQPRSTTNDDLTFSLDGVFGQALLRVLLNRDTVQLESVSIGGRDVTDQPVDFDRAPDGLIKDVEIVLTTRAPELTGTVTDERGQRVLDYSAIVFAADSDRWAPPSRFVSSARSDGEGTFVIRTLPPGQYRAVALDEVEEGQWEDPKFLAGLSPSATLVTLTKGEKQTLSLKLRRP